MANTLGKLGRFEEAETHFKEAIYLKPGYALYHVNLGQLYFEEYVMKRFKIYLMFEFIQCSLGQKIICIDVWRPEQTNSLN